MFHVRTGSPQRTIELAQRIGQKITPGVVLALSGELGAGKTTFAQGLAQGLGIEETVLSPTFIFFQQYQGRLPFYHIDAYRLGSDEGYDIGLEECFGRDSVALVEWPQNISYLLPDDCLCVEIKYCQDGHSQGRDFYFDVTEGQYLWLEDILCSF
ncbi:MAG: tRNA (adenosine(37)-N6)-threonylcarbamoyltransferase complex ATPase subunit type 1 TsaE [Bacillota bacterium]